MRRWALRLLVAAALLAAGALGAGLALLYTADTKRVADEAARQLGRALGQEVRFEGEASVGLWPVPGVHLDGVVTAGGAIRGGRAVVVPGPLSLLVGGGRAWGIVLVGSEIDLDRGAATGLLQRAVTAPRAELPGFVALLAGRIRLGDATPPVARVSALAAPGPDMVLHLTGDWRGGNVGLAFAAEDPRRLFDAAGTRIDLDLEAGRDRIAYHGLLGRDPATGRVTSDGRGSLKMAAPRVLADILGVALPARLAALTDLDGTLETRTLETGLRLKVNAAGKIGDRLISVQATTTGPAGWRTRGPDRLDVVSRGGGLFSAYLSGRFDGPGTLVGTLTASASNLSGVQDLLGIPAEARLIEAARGTVHAEFEADADGVRTRGGEIRLGERTLPAALTLTLAARPLLSVGLEMPELDLTDAHASAYSRLRHALSALHEAGADLSLTVKAARVRLGEIAMGAVDLGLTHRDGTATIEIARLEVLDGLVKGRLALATRGPARLTGQLALAEIDAARLSGLAGLGLVTGTADGVARFEFPDLARAGAGAGGGTAIGEVTILDGTLALPRAGQDAMAFRRADLTLTLDDGRVTARRLVLDRADGRAEGEMTIALADRSLAGGLVLSDGTRLAIGGSIDAPTARRRAAGEAARPGTEIEPAETAARTGEGPLPAGETAPGGAETAVAVGGTLGPEDPRPDGDPVDIETPEPRPGPRAWAEIRTAAADGPADAAPGAAAAPDAGDGPGASGPAAADTPETAASDTAAPPEVANVPIPIPAPR